MKLLQAYYTSCQIGQTSSSGFQFYSYSSGITETELDEIGKLGSYTAPYGSNPSPSNDEVINVLPVAFKYFRLSSGRVGVMQSTACTMEYTGRPGNFFTHTLLLEQGDFPVMPILLQGCNVFKHDLTDEEKRVQTVPVPLPPLSINQSDISPKWNNFSILQYLKHGNNEELLSKLLDIFLTDKYSQKKVIIADSEAEKLIYGLSNALPSENVHKLTFSTYSLRPEGQNVVLSASRHEGSDFNFDDSSMAFNYFIFNNATGKHTEVENQSELSKTLVRLLATDPKKVGELYSFSSNFKGEKDTNSMDLIASILSKQYIPTKWKQILPFVSDNANIDYLEVFLSEYKDQIFDLIQTRKDDHEIFLLFKETLRLIHRSQQASVLLKELFQVYLELLVGHLNTPTKALTDFNKHLLTLLNSTDKSIFSEQFFVHHTLSTFSMRAHTELEVMNAFVLIGCSLKPLTDSFLRLNELLNWEEVETIIKNIDEERTPSDSFNVLISELQDQMDVILKYVSKYKADSLGKRIILELVNEKYIGVFYKLVQGDILNIPGTSIAIREEIVLQLEEIALVKAPTEEELKVYSLLGKHINLSKCPSIGLVVAKVDLTVIFEQMVKFKDAKKLSVFVAWRRNDIISSLKQTDDWGKYFALAPNLAPDYLYLQVKNYFEETGDSNTLESLVVYLHNKGNNQMDDLLRQVLTLVKRTSYNNLKQNIERGHPAEVNAYFTSINKGVSIKRLFKFNF